MIYVGYPCIGKSSIAGQENFIDLECSTFKHLENWEQVYVSTAIELSKQGYHVMLSSHRSVRDELEKQEQWYIAVFPHLKLKDKWFNRAANRYKNNPSDKNLRALERITKFYKEDIQDLMTCEHAAIIESLEKFELLTFIINYKYPGTSIMIINGEFIRNPDYRSGEVIPKEMESLLNDPEPE